MSTLARRFSIGNAIGTGTPSDPACVKVIFGNRVNIVDSDIEVYQAIYFSRSLIPHPRSSKGIADKNEAFFMHIGMYAYSMDSLLEYTQLKKSRLESIEQLEQLRIIENYLTLNVGIIDHAVPGVDTLEDYAAFVARWNGKKL
jgi:3-deoxy-manno-octulosonate cytidylyltransferase (CMP-KDO synthetase)